MTENKDQQAFARSLHDYIEKAVADNPALMRLRRLNQAVVAEVRRRLHDAQAVKPFGAVADEAGNVDLIEVDGDPSSEVIVARLRKIVAAGNFFAATLCTLVERVPPTAAKAITFIEMHSEDKSGLAVVAGLPADEKENAAGMVGVKGPAVGGYKKKVSPIIFSKS